jgi:phosphotransferase system HPr-like phosphotransfer protein
MGGILVKQFSVWMRSFEDIQSFVALASQQPFDISVGTDDQDISAKSLMAVLGLNFRKPVTVHMDCDDNQFAIFQAAAARFLA